MAPPLHWKAFLAFLVRLRFAGHYAKRCLGRLTLLLASSLFGRKFRQWWQSRPGKPVSSSSAAGGSTIVKEYTVAASTVPASASHQNLHEHSPGLGQERQSATATPTVGIPPPNLAGISVDHPHDPNSPHPFGGRSPINCSSGNLSAVSIQSRASDRFSIIVNSPESIRVPVGQPSRHSSHQSPPLPVGIMTTNLPSPTHGGERFMKPHPMHEIRKRQSPTGVVEDVQSPLPISSSTNTQQVTDEPFAIDPASLHSSAASAAVNPHDERVPSSPESSNAMTLDNYIPEGRFVQLINSDQIPRYTKDVLIPREETPFDVRPLTTTFPYFPEPSDFEQDSMIQQDCSPWVPATHPDGALYFYDEERRLFTDTDMHNSILREEIEAFYDYLQRLLHDDNLSIPSKNYDLVLEITVTADGRISWSYYYACHDSRCLFWLEPYDASYMVSELFGVKSPAHVKYRIESLYWKHWSLYPVVFDGRRLPIDVYDELMGMLMYGCIDFMTSKTSTLPFDDDTMRRMAQLVQAAREATGGLAYFTAGTTRLLTSFAHWRFLYFHGQKHARLTKDQTVYNKPKRERTLLITFLSPLLFLAPDSYLRKMEKLWTDEVIIESDWKIFMTKLIGQWESVILWSTVMLTANVGFLAIPGVVLSNINGTNLTSASQVTIFTSPTQVASCLSIQASIGSIVIGMPLVRRHITKSEKDPASASTYLYQNSHPSFGLEPMAIIFSLPWALLMWSMVTFFIALLLFCFIISNKSTRISVGVISAIVAVLVAWSFRALESNIAGDVWYSSLIVLRRRGRRFLTRLKRLSYNTFGFHYSPPTARVPGQGTVRTLSSYHLGGVGV